jgi:hypothetical protein
MRSSLSTISSVLCGSDEIYDLSLRGDVGLEVSVGSAEGRVAKVSQMKLSVRSRDDANREFRLQDERDVELAERDLVSSPQPSRRFLAASGFRSSRVPKPMSSQKAANLQPVRSRNPQATASPIERVSSFEAAALNFHIAKRRVRPAIASFTLSIGLPNTLK